MRPCSRPASGAPASRDTERSSPQRGSPSLDSVLGSLGAPLSTAPPLASQVLFEQFSYFFNLYFLLVAASQFFPPLMLGLRFSYVAPLAFVLVVTMSKEAYDDRRRFREDRALNLQSYARLLPGGTGATEQVHAQDVAVGQVLQIRTNQRVPADVVLLRTSERSGDVYLRTEQLDGERSRGEATCTLPLPLLPLRLRLRLSLVLLLFTLLAAYQVRPSGSCAAPCPSRKGSAPLTVRSARATECSSRRAPRRTPTSSRATSCCMTRPSRAAACRSEPTLPATMAPLAVALPHPLTVCYGSAASTYCVLCLVQERLGLEHTMWANSVLASGTATGVVVHTGRETRAAANSAPPRTKMGSIDLQVNNTLA